MGDSIAVSIAIDVGVSLAVHGAEKIAARAQPILQRLFKRRFEGEQAPDVHTAVGRLEPFMGELDARLRMLEQREALSDARVEEAFARPEFTGALYSAFEAAMETDDPLTRNTLADLVVARLLADNESADAPAIRIAIDRIRDVTPSQVKLLAFVSFLHTDPFYDWDPPLGDSDRDAYLKWLSTIGGMLVHTARTHADILHVRSLGLLEIDPSYAHFEGGFTPRPLNAIHQRFYDLITDPRLRDIIVRIEATAGGIRDSEDPVMLAACSLTPAGDLIAQNALDDIERLAMRLGGERRTI